MKAMAEPLLSANGEAPEEKDGVMRKLRSAIFKSVWSNRFASESLTSHALPSTILAQSHFVAGTHFTDRVEELGLLEGREPQIEKCLPAALDRESYGDIRWYNLLRHKIWRREHEKLAEMVLPPLPSDEKWLDQLPWPMGVRADAGFFRTCIALSVSRIEPWQFRSIVPSWNLRKWLDWFWLAGRLVEASWTSG